MTLDARPHGDGDAWVEGPEGQRFWGTHGAAGLLVVDPSAGVLLQHRVEWSHFGGTWGLPGGARHAHESAWAGAAREANEEAGVPADALRPHFLSLLDLGWWSYSTVVVDAVRGFDAVIGDAESLELRWVPVAEVDSLPLHPGLAMRWPSLRDALGVRPHVIVDAANVVGSRPDGWWRDRAGATARLVGRLGALGTQGWPAGLLGLPHDLWWPRVSVVIEGEAKRMLDPLPDRSGASPAIVRAPADGDSAIVECVAASPGAERPIVVTADRGLRDRVIALGAAVASPGALQRTLDSPVA